MHYDNKTRIQWQQEFVSKARDIHHGKYDYSLVEYYNTNTPVSIVCPHHGTFKKRPVKHLSDAEGCPHCARIERIRKSSRFKTFKDVALACGEEHQFQYDYANIISDTLVHGDIITSNSKINIVCPLHGMFTQTINKHLYSHTGCPKCLRDRVKKVRTKTTEQFIKDAIHVHGDIYNYDNTRYVNVNVSVEVSCPTHGPFYVTPRSHILAPHVKCPVCSLKDRNDQSTKRFIEKSKQIFGDTFSYKNTKWKSVNEKLTISCKKHGDFDVLPFNHLAHMSGCPICNTSKGETIIFQFLKEHMVDFQYQVKFMGCKSKRPLIFDFYLPEFNTVIEYDGEQHFTPVRFGGSSLVAEKMFKRTLQHDDIKNKFLISQKIELLRIPHWDKSRIPEILLRFTD